MKFRKDFPKRITQSRLVGEMNAIKQGLVQRKQSKVFPEDFDGLEEALNCSEEALELACGLLGDDYLEGPGVVYEGEEAVSRYVELVQRHDEDELSQWRMGWILEAA